MNTAQYLAEERKRETANRLEEVRQPRILAAINELHAAVEVLEGRLSVLQDRLAGRVLTPLAPEVAEGGPVPPRAPCSEVAQYLEGLEERIRNMASGVSGLLDRLEV